MCTTLWAQGTITGNTCDGVTFVASILVSSQVKARGL